MNRKTGGKRLDLLIRRIQLHLHRSARLWLYSYAVVQSANLKLKLLMKYGWKQADEGMDYVVCTEVD